VFCFKQASESERQKLLNTCIKICLDNSVEFSPDVLKECIGTLLTDPVLGNSIMRTVIVSFSIHPVEMRRFAVTDVVPAMVRRRAWLTPRVWDGVILAMKNLAGHRDAESSLRAMLGLPASQLHTLMKIKEVKGPLSKCLKALSVGEREDVVTGRWVGIDDAASGTIDTLKAKLLEELNSFLSE
jgi:hypothetical protein